MSKGLDRVFFMVLHVVLTSRAETICRGRRAALRSVVLVSRSYKAWAMLVSSSEGFCREGLLAAILLRAWADILTVVHDGVVEDCRDAGCKEVLALARSFAKLGFSCPRVGQICFRLRFESFFGVHVI